MNKGKDILILAGKGVGTNAMYHFLKKEFNIVGVIIEKPVPLSLFLKKRIKKLGFGTVFGQLLFQFIVVKFLSLISQKRKNEIWDKKNLIKTEIDSKIVHQVFSVNDKNTLEIIQSLKPNVIVVCGTRIISKNILQSANAKFINIHAGITPKYRGVHGAYWALVNNDKKNCGVTIHLVDEGIDTGSVLYQKNIEIVKKDNFVTYPIIQFTEGLGLLKLALNDILENNEKLFYPNLESKIWSHPHILKYLFNYFTKGIK